MQTQDGCSSLVGMYHHLWESDNLETFYIQNDLVSNDERLVLYSILICLTNVSWIKIELRNKQVVVVLLLLEKMIDRKNPSLHISIK